MSRRGFTLIEVMISVTVLAIVSGAIFVLAAAMGEAARVQETKTTTEDEARDGMEFLAKELRQAVRSSINWVNLPGPRIQYCVPIDADGNGTAVNVNTQLEQSALRVIQRDTNDLNGDGIRGTQLIMTDGVAPPRVITNGLLISEDTNGNGVPDPGEDRNSNGSLDRGIWFQQSGNDLIITLQTERLAEARGQIGRTMMSELTQIIIPRNQP